MSSSSSASGAVLVAKKKLPLVPLAFAALVALAVVALIVQALGWRETLEAARALLDRAMAVVTGAGPVVFFTAMALLPAAGVPMLTFALTAGPLFGPTLGLLPVTLLGLAALTVNLTLTYWLGRRWLRPWLTRLFARMGYALPSVESGDATDLVVLLRVTPGVPFFVQNYLCGLADVPFRKYLTISCAIAWTYNCAFIFFGDALLHGKGKVAMLAFGALAALTVGTHFLRKHYGKKKMAAAAG